MPGNRELLWGSLQGPPPSKFQVLFQALRTLYESDYTHVYSAVEKPLQLLHTAAVLEIRNDLIY